MGKTKCLTHNSYLILEEKLYWLAKLKLKVIGKTAHVVVGLNRLFALCLLDAFQNVGVDGALC